MKPLLIDFDGVIYLGGKFAPDTKQFLSIITSKKIPSIILANSTLKTGKDIQSEFEHAGLPTSLPAMTTIDAAIQFVKESGKKVSVYCDENVKTYFEDFIVPENPDIIIIGDIGNRWNYEILNKIFLQVMNGAEVLALHKNRYWSPDGKVIQLDSGPFITAIEYATGKQTTLLGKPSRVYFQSALHRLGFGPDDPFIILGDDIECDINAAQSIGGTGILILTGKTKLPLTASLQKPDYVVNNLTEAIEIINRLQW